MHPGWWVSTAGAIPPGHKFCCIALQEASVVQGFTFQQLSDEAGAFPKAPFDLDQTWRQWLGSLRIETLSDANFILLAVAPSARPGELDAESEHLETVASRHLQALMLCGIPSYMRGLVLNGGIGDVTTVRQVKDLSVYRYHAKAVEATIDDVLLSCSAEVAAGLEHIHAAREAYRRLKLGLQSWHRACLARFYHDRLHLYSRALQALLKPAQGRTTKQFTTRGQLMIGRSAESAARLAQVYELRSATEHLNDWEELLTGFSPKKREALITQRAFEIEVIASQSLARVLRTPTLLEYFKDDQQIEQFWELDDRERTALWGAPLDIEAVLEKRYHPRILRRKFEKYGDLAPPDIADW